MARRSRSVLVNVIGVAALVAVLVVAGRLTSGNLRPPATTATLPALVVHPTSTVPSPVVARVAGMRPRRDACAVLGVRVGAGAVWASLWGMGLLRRLR